ncbi:hypothetical protein SSPIM334S_07665 [Streptomyces spiroverticillatus]
MLGAEVGDLGEGVDLPGVGRSCGRGHEEGVVQVGQRLVEGGQVQDAGGGGHDDGLGEPEEPGGAGERVVGVGSDDQLHRSVQAVLLAGEEEGELVGLGAAGGDEGVGVRAGREDLGREGAGEGLLQGGGGGGLVPGVHGRVERGGGEVGGDGHGQRRAVQVGGAVGVGGVGGACREGVHEGAERFVRPGSGVGEERPDRLFHLGGAARGTAGREGPRAGGGAGGEGGEDRTEQWPQGGGPGGPAGEGGVGRGLALTGYRVLCRRRRAHAGPSGVVWCGVRAHQGVQGRRWVSGVDNERNSKVVRGCGEGELGVGGWYRGWAPSVSHPVPGAVGVRPAAVGLRRAGRRWCGGGYLVERTRRARERASSWSVSLRRSAGVRSGEARCSSPRARAAGVTS